MRIPLVLAAVAAVAVALPGQLRADNPKLIADVGKNDALVISLKDSNGNNISSIPAGTYDVVVHDRSAFHNFHLTGPGVDEDTGVSFVGDKTWTVTFRAGSYKFVCDPHASQMKGSFTVTPGTADLAVARSGDGAGTVTSSPAGISCGGTCTASFQADSTVTLTATPATGSVFSGWGGACTGTSTCALAMSEAKSVSATFTLQRLGLVVVRSGNGHGAVTSAPDGIDCGGTCAATFAFGTNVVLAAAPEPDSVFTGWGGSCEGAAACSVTVDAAKSVTADFKLKRFAVRVAKRGSGSVFSTPGGILCGARCAASFDYGTAVRLAARPRPGSTFAGWSGGCTCAFTVTTDRAVRATFAPVVVRAGKAGVDVTLRVDRRQPARLELLRAGRTTAARAFPLHAGQNLLHLAAGEGPYVLRVTVAGRRVLTRAVRVGG